MLESLVLPPWTLSARHDADVLEFSLTDGLRLASRMRQSAELLCAPVALGHAEQLLGKGISDRLASSPTRTLNLQLDADLDKVAWEALRLGSVCLGEQFAVARQPASDSEPPCIEAVPLAGTLGVVVVHGETAKPFHDASCLALSMLHSPHQRDTALEAAVLVLEGVTLGQLMGRLELPLHERLLVLQGPAPFEQVGAALDRGASVLMLTHDQHSIQAPLQSLLLQLGSGATVGAVLRRFHGRTALASLGARFYGNAALRFVRAQAPASRRRVTSLSFDLVGSTAVLRRLGDEAYSDMLASLHMRCTDIVRKHGGWPDDPQGDDGVMSYFGHPTAVEDAATRAVEAGLQILRIVAELGVSVRVGIATGLVAVRAGQPVGLSIHLSARLQQVAAPGTLLASEGTRRLVSHAFDLEALTHRPDLKGIELQESIYLVRGPNAQARWHRLERQAWLTPLVGRVAELQQLSTCWERVRSPECQLVLVRAEAGMGKSRLVREFRSTLVQRGVKVLECRCRPDASASPFLALSEALRRWLGIGTSEVGTVALQKVAAALPAHWREGEPLALLAALLGVSPQLPPMSPIRVRQRMLALLLDWFDVFARAQPCCLIVEDWHWVDPSMRDFVEHLVERSGGPGLLLVVTSRDDAHLGAPRLGDLSRIELAGLSVDEARELVHRVAGNAQLPGHLERTLAARGDGVPLFLEEATRMAYEVGSDGPAPDSAALAAVPASLEDLLTARLDSVGAAKQVAQAAAVLGREFSPEWLAALIEAGPMSAAAGSLTELLGVLEAAGLVRLESAERHVFKHALLRDAAYASLWTRDRLALHAQVVDLLRYRWPEQAERRPELLAHHLTEAGLHAQALAQWERAAHNATARSAELEAISHLRRALALLHRIDDHRERDTTALRLQLMLAARLIATEGYGAEAVSCAYLEAGRLCNILGDDTARFKVEMGLGGYRFMRADFEPALAHGRRAAAIATRSSDIKQRLQAHWGLACTLFHQGQLRAAMREMETGLALYSPALHRQFGVQDPGVMCLSYSSWGLWECARPDAAVSRIHNAISIANEFEHKFSQAVALAYCVSIHLLRGEHEAALAQADACIAVCEDSGFPVWLAITRCMRGRVLCGRGDLGAGLAEMREGYALWLSTGSLVSQPLYLGLQAEGLALSGDREGATACVSKGLQIAAQYGERQHEAELRRLRGELVLQRGDLAEAEVWLKGAHVLALRQHRLGFALRSATSLARLWAAQGRTQRARRLLGPLLARWHEGLGTHDVRTAQALYDSLA